MASDASTSITGKVDIVERLRIHADAIEDGTPVPYGKMGEVQRLAAEEITLLRLALRRIQDGWYLTDEPALIEVDSFGEVHDEWTHPVIERAIDTGSTDGADR